MRYIIAISLVLFASTASAGGFREDKAWDFLTPLENQLRINRAMYQDKHEGGMFEAQAVYLSIQNIQNIGTMSYISGNGNIVTQSNTGDQTAENTIAGGN